MARGPKKHLKRLNAPKHWMLDKLTGTYVCIVAGSSTLVQDHNTHHYHLLHHRLYRTSTATLEQTIVSPKPLSKRSPEKNMKKLIADPLYFFSSLKKAPRPTAGPHKLRECLPLIILIRN
ncbi:hypothetical protein BG004_004214, partial [Podila humilis]